MKKRSKKSVISIVIKLLIITLLVVGTIVGTIVWLLIRVEEKQKIKEEEMRIQEAEIVKRAENYLEDKYGKKFLVNPDGFNDAGSFIPGKVVNNYQLCYEASPSDDQDYVFRVYFDIDTNNNQYSEQIRDNYCWKFLKEKLKEEIKNNINKKMNMNYKLLIKTDNYNTYDDIITPYSSAEDYYKNQKSIPDIVIYLYVPENNQEIEKIIKQEMTQLFDLLKQNVNKLSIKFVYFVLEDEEDFESISETDEENNNFRIHCESTYNNAYNRKRSMEKEEKFRININN